LDQAFFILDGNAIHDNIAGIDLFQPVDATQHGALATAAGATDHNDLTEFDFGVYPP